MDNVEEPRGRTTSILLLALLTFGAIVSTMVPLLSQHSRYHMSFLVESVVEISIFVFALIAMVLIIILRKHNGHLMMTQDDISRKLHVTRCLIFALFGLSASILPFYECKKVSTCLDVEDRESHALQFATYLCIGIYTNFHSIFALLCYKYRCKSVLTRLLVVVIFSANASLLAICLMKTPIRSLNTQPSRDPFNHPKNTSLNGSDAREYYFGHTLVYSVCENGTEIIDHSDATKLVHKYTYPLLGQFLLFSLTLLVPLWNIDIHRQTNPDNIPTDVSTTPVEISEHVQEQNERQHLLSTASVNTWQGIIVGTIRWISQHSIMFSSGFAGLVLVLHVFVEIRTGPKLKHKQLTKYDVGYYYLQTIYTYIISFVPFIGYFIARQRQNPPMQRFDVDTALLFLGGCGHILFDLFETVDSIMVISSHSSNHTTEDVMYFIRLLFDYVGIYFQIKVILKAFCLHLGQGGFLDQEVHVKGIIIFLGICSAERWLADSFMPPTTLKYASDIQGDDIFGHVNWCVIVQDLFPMVNFYRIWSALMCFKAYDILNQNRSFR